MKYCPYNRCGGVGYTEYETHRNGKYFVQLFKCCNEDKYAAEVKRRHAMEQPPSIQPVATVIQFPGRKT